VVQVVALRLPSPSTRVAVRPPRLAAVAPVKTTSRVPFEWLVLAALLGWHSVQAMGL
jgi:hypothetical protein